MEQIGISFSGYSYQQTIVSWTIKSDVKYQIRVFQFPRQTQDIASPIFSTVEVKVKHFKCDLTTVYQFMVCLVTFLEPESCTYLNRSM